MTEYIFITCGGSGHRLQETMPYPKALYQLPDGQTVLHRLLAQLKASIPICFCTGYKSVMIRQEALYFPEIETYDVKNPTNILHCFHQVMEVDHDTNFGYSQDSYTFILGDTIWHPKALEQALSKRLTKPIMVCRNRDNPVCENYMITFSGAGIDMFKEVYALGKLPPALKNEPYLWQPEGGGVPFIPIKQCKILHLAKYLSGNPHTCKKNIGGDPRFGGFVPQHPVTDFDIQIQLDKVIEDYKRGIYDE